MNAKRGSVPEDEKNFSPSAQETFRTAAGHIDLLLHNDKGSSIL